MSHERFRADVLAMFTRHGNTRSGHPKPERITYVKKFADGTPFHAPYI